MKEQIKLEVLEILEKEMVEANMKFDKEKVVFSKTFVELGFDSMQIMNLLVDMEDKFNVYIPDEEFMSITLEDYILRAENNS